LPDSHSGVAAPMPDVTYRAVPSRPNLAEPPFQKPLDS